MPLFFALLLAAVAPAAEADLHSHRYFLHEENSVFVVDEIARDKFGWPEITKTHRFATKNSADRFFAQHSEPQAMSELSLDPEGAAREAPALTGSAALWEVQNQWSWDWELRYADWVRANVKADFFVLNDISTDCADVAYALRWIFARINHLPMTSRLYTGEWFSEKSLHPDWQSLPTDPDWNKDQRFLAALRYVLHLTYTHTLVDDAYPVAVRRESILEGGFQLYVHEHSGHTQPIVHVMREGEGGIPMEILQSTLPRAVRTLMFDGYWNTEQQAKGKGGLLRFRWPLSGGKGLVKAEQMPYFSEEQYAPEFKNKDEAFFLAVFRRVWPELKIEDIAHRLLADTRLTFQRRQEIVQQGYDFCRQNPCAPGTDGWENWSTPSRDERAGQQLSQLNRMVGLLPDDKRALLEAPMKEPVFTTEGIPVTLDLLTWAWDQKIFSVDPRDPPSIRWAVTPDGFDGFIQKTIRTQWAKRNELLATTSNCPPQQCVPGSEEWKKRYPVAIDYELLRIPLLSIGYCYRVTDHCPELQERLHRKFDLLGDLTLEETLARFRFLNADPRHPLEFRQNGAASLFRTLALPSYASVTASKNFLLTTNGDGDGQDALWDIRRDPVKIEPKHGKWNFLNRQSDEAYFISENTAGLVRLLTGETFQVSLEFTPNALQSEQPGLALARNNKQWAFLRLSPEGLRAEFTGAAERYRVMDANHVLFEKDGKAYIASATAEPKEIALPIEAVSGGPVATDLGWYINVNNTLYLILRADYSVSILDTDSSYPLIAKNGRALLIASKDNQGRMIELDAQGKVTSERKIGKVKVTSAGLSTEEAGQKVVYAVTTTGVRRIALLPGEDEVTSMNGDTLIIKKGTGQILRNVSDSAPLLRSEGNIHFLPGQATREGFVHVCEKFEYSEENMRVYTGFCRIENFLHPEQFSVFTGVNQTGYLYPGSENNIERGFVFLQPSASIWAEYLGN